MVQHTAIIVMVHGAWHGPWCFERVVPLLRDADVDARAVALAGEGYESDVASVRDALDGIAGDVVLLGHSYGGAVITEAGVHPAGAPPRLPVRLHTRRGRVVRAAPAVDGEPDRGVDLAPRAGPTSGRRW